MSDSSREPSGRAPAWLEPGLGMRGDDPRALTAAAAGFARDGRACIEPALAPGLAAELAAFIPALDLLPHWDAARAFLSWRCLVRVPDGFEPQYPLCLYRLGHALTDELPALASAIAGHEVVAHEPRTIDIRVLRKGSYRDLPPDIDLGVGPDIGPGGAIEYIIGLCGARLPASFGGHLELPGREPGRRDTHDVGWDTLHLVRPPGPRIPIVSHHVFVVLVVGTLVPAAAAHDPEDGHAP